ncbi:unnamed protein product, partial [Strongylus vulgaris]
KVNKGMIPFEERSIIAGHHRYLVKDVFDGHASPYLHRGIDRIFVPHYHKKRRHRNRHRDRSSCGDSRDSSDCFGEQDPNVRKLFGKDPYDPELPVPTE